MQQDNVKLLQLKQAIGEVVKEIRYTEPHISMTKLAYEYDVAKGTLSMLEQGTLDSRISTLWKIAEARGIKFSEFARRLEEKLGDNFKFMDE